MGGKFTTCAGRAEGGLPGFSEARFAATRLGADTLPCSEGSSARERPGFGFDSAGAFATVTGDARVARFEASASFVAPPRDVGALALADTAGAFDAAVFIRGAAFVGGRALAVLDAGAGALAAAAFTGGAGRVAIFAGTGVFSAGAFFAAAFFPGILMPASRASFASAGTKAARAAINSSFLSLLYPLPRCFRASSRREPTVTLLRSSIGTVRL
ncbi:hypothetical protein ACJ2CR_09485 [Myxococcus faecalis]|uniref:hypothetical protein n=1 Tax=Myxococcus faecalis TaxID=3115646 RepID=UPI0038D05ACD